MGLENIIKSIIALIIVIWLANFLLNKLNSYSKGQAKMIQVIERYPVSKTSSLAIVKIINRYYLMSLSESSSEILEEFSSKEAYEIVEQMNQQESIDPSMVMKQIDLTAIKEKYTHFFERAGE